MGSEMCIRDSNDVGEVVAAVFDLFEERRDSTSFAYVLVCGKLFHLHA